MCKDSEFIFSIVDDYLKRGFEPNTHAQLLDYNDISLSATEFIKDNAKIIKNYGFQLYIYCHSYKNIDEQLSITKPKIGEYKKLLPFIWRLINGYDSNEEYSNKPRPDSDYCWSWLLEFINLNSCISSSYRKPEKFIIKVPEEYIEYTDNNGYIVYIANGEVYI